MMCLSSGQRSQNLAYLATDCMHLNKSGCVFNMSKVLKTSRPKSHQKLIEFKAYLHDVSLCVVALIKLYLDKTAALRHDVNSMFFISYATPHKPVSLRTLARWVSDILHKQVFIPKHLNLILSVQHQHQMHSVVVCPFPILPRQLDGQM